MFRKGLHVRPLPIHWLLDFGQEHLRDRWVDYQGEPK
jgi:hypothetical protein